MFYSKGDFFYRASTRQSIMIRRCRAMDLEISKLYLTIRRWDLMDSKTAAESVSCDCERWDDRYGVSQLFGSCLNKFIKFPFINRWVSEGWMMMNKWLIRKNVGWAELDQWQLNFLFCLHVVVNWKFLNEQQDDEPRKRLSASTSTDSCENGSSYLLGGNDCAQSQTNNRKLGVNEHDDHRSNV